MLTVLAQDKPQQMECIGIGWRRLQCLAVVVCGGSQISRLVLGESGLEMFSGGAQTGTNETFRTGNGDHRTETSSA
jgi:hypothetical protein